MNISNMYLYKYNNQSFLNNVIWQCGPPFPTINPFWRTDIYWPSNDTDSNFTIFGSWTTWTLNFVFGSLFASQHDTLLSVILRNAPDLTFLNCSYI